MLEITFFRLQLITRAKFAATILNWSYAEKRILDWLISVAMKRSFVIAQEFIDIKQTND